MSLCDFIVLDNLILPRKDDFESKWHCIFDKFLIILERVAHNANSRYITIFFIFHGLTISSIMWIWKITYKCFLLKIPNKYVNEAEIDRWSIFMFIQRLSVYVTKILICLTTSTYKYVYNLNSRCDFRNFVSEQTK